MILGCLPLRSLRGFWNRACIQFLELFRVYPYLVVESANIQPRVLGRGAEAFKPASSLQILDGGHSMSIMRVIREAGLFCFLVAFLVMATVAGAQTSNGTLVGAVTDQTGAVVPNVNVKVE